MIAAKKLNALIVWVREKSVPKPAAKFVKGIAAVSLAASVRGEIKPASAPPKKKWWRKERRGSMTIPELEQAILEAIKATPGCEDFVGVIVAHEMSKSHRDPNWAIRGVKFGKADRKIANEALDRIVKRMQREYRLSAN